MATPLDNYIIARNTGEAERLRVQHEYMLSCQGYYLHPDIPPLSADTKVADVCTGTAIFLKDLAAANPKAEYHGFDISDSMFPSDLPSNIHLHLTDVKQPFEKQWQGVFDIVHIRFLEAAMKKDDWAKVLRHLVTLLKPGGWLQWVEDDRAHAVRHAARPVAPANAAKLSLTRAGGYRPPRILTLDRFNRLLMSNERADDMTYGYMNLDYLMKDPEAGGLEDVGCDMYVIDRQDDGGQLRRDWTTMGMAAVESMMKSRADSGATTGDWSQEELIRGFQEDMQQGGHFITRATVFTGRKPLK